MGKKAKIAKQPKGKGKIQQSAQKFEVFSSAFYETLDSFKGFYKEVLELKSKEQGADLSGEFEDVREKVSKELEEASSNILKDELSSLESWIEKQQNKITQETQKIQQAFKSNSESLNATGVFSEDEVRKQLKPIQDKIDAKKADFERYGDLLAKAKEIYQ